MISMQKKTQTMQGAEDVSSVPLLYENGENENTNCNSFDSQNTSLTFYPQPYKEKFMGKLASFLAGVISGAVALGVTACYIDQLDKSSSCEDEQADDEQKSSCLQDDKSASSSEVPTNELS